MRTAILFFSLLVLAAPATLSAQDEPQLREGDRVKVSSPTHRGTFSLRQIGADTLTLGSITGPDTVYLASASVTKLLVYRGPQSKGAGALRGFGFGVLVGGVTGAVVGLISGEDRCEGGEFCVMQMSAGEKAALAGILLGAAGGVVGLLIGAAAPGERWERVELPLEIGASRGTTGGLLIFAALRV